MKYSGYVVDFTKRRYADQDCIIQSIDQDLKDRNLSVHDEEFYLKFSKMFSKSMGS